MNFFTCQRHSTLHFVSALCCDLPAAVPLPVVFLAAGISGVVVHHSHSLCSARQVQSSPLAEPLLVWPHRGDTRRPSPKWQLLAPTPCLWISRMAQKWNSHVTDSLPAHLPTGGKTNHGEHLFMLSFSPEQLVKIQAALNSCTVKHKHRQAFANTQLQTEIIPTQIACHCSAAHTGLETPANRKRCGI